MARPQRLTRRDGTYYVRIHVPADLVAAMNGKKEFWRSLRTKEYADAKRRELPERDQWAITFDDMRRRSELTAEDMANAVWDHYSAGLAAGDKERLNRPTSAAIDAAEDKAIASAIANGVDRDGVIAMINAMTDVEVLAGSHEWAARRRSSRLNRLRKDLATGDTRLIERDVDAFLSKHGFTVERGGEKYRELCSAMTRAEIEQLQRTAERDKGDFTGKPADPIVTEPANVPALTGGTDTGIMVLFGRYEKENPGNIRPETFLQIRRDVKHFAEFVGPRLPAPKITKAHIRGWKELLADWPVKASETNVFKGLRATEVIAMNRKLDHPKPTLTRQTVRRYMSSLGGFCAWLSANDYLDGNPVTGMLPSKAPPTVKRKSLTDDQMKALFSTPLFTSCFGKDWRGVAKAGDVRVRDHRYWIPLVMAYSGARPGEIAQLHVGDVKQQHGIWTMHITEENGEGKRTKTNSSMRSVPIHSELITLGFVKHCQAMAAHGEKQIFPEVEIPAMGQIAARFSREFNRYLAKMGVKSGKEIVTYSLRHTFIDRARAAGILDQEIGMVVGHDKATMTGRYGNEQEGTLRRRSEIVEAVAYSLR